MKKMITVLFLALGLSTFAQERGEGRKDLSSEEMATLSAKRLAMQLDLNEDQEMKLKALYMTKMDAREEGREENAEKRAEMMEKRDAMKEKREEMREKRKADSEEMKADLQKILTADQFQKWEQLQEKRRKGRRSGNGTIRN
ncbi:uncharacterized protein DUF4890 [Gramella sp. Hel_I_59]|uniref:DUF4890 domain-containing protein n=1 Tax=Gramella sp. Hel_I_59 TaxID=1249978 RepID=UPI001153DC56|nr:DUF4890 domain-containing protein [Gramella sp. Hel_I_59]TQI69744.1 uncharacterized protein DUF4890 [Gramella sp. Hel_I_59]